MATRRSRIKGVLNIPARRKTGDPSNDELIKEETPKRNNNDNSKNIKSSPSETHVADEISQKAIAQSSDCEGPDFSNLKLTKPTSLDSTIQGITKLPVNTDHVLLRSDIDAPPSPTKVNRTRIKAIPRLGQRRISFSIGSASESEDDSRRQLARHRNDSVCSLVSNIDDNRPQQSTGTCSTAGAVDASTATGGGSIPTLTPAKKEFNCVIQRKCRRTEQARKLATAKRDFLHKFRGDKPPDRQRLTMMDLIFYNPTTNPMVVDRDKGTVSKEIKDATKTKSDMDDADDPGRKSDEEIDEPEDQDDAIAPQVTIDADGEIIIDEKSLLIENKNTVKERQKLAKTNIVDGDENTGYGIYKRVKRTKDWSKTETLRFYKALNTIGTDFTLMSQLFPNRTRRELKMKFKKEERINHVLIDKAVLEPVHFDMKDLEADLEKELLFEKELELRKKEVSIARCVNKLKRRKKPSENHLGISDKMETTPIQRVTILNGTRNYIMQNADLQSERKIVNSVFEVLDESDDDDENNTDSDDGNSKDTDDYVPPSTHNLPEATVGVQRPKRNLNSRHIYKKTKLKRVDPLSTNSDENDHDSDRKQNLTNALRGEESLEPGSLIIVSNSKSQSAEPEFKIFMITTDKKKVPIDLPSDIVKNLAANAGNGAIARSHDIILGIENNYTINEELVENNYTINEAETQCVITCDMEKSPIVSSEIVTENFTTENGHPIQSGGDILILPLD